MMKTLCLRLTSSIGSNARLPRQFAWRCIVRLVTGCSDIAIGSITAIDFFTFSYSRNDINSMIMLTLPSAPRWLRKAGRADEVVMMNGMTLGR